MKEFKILEEALLDYDKNNQLYLMQIKTGEHYFIEINSQKSLIGRLPAGNRKEVEGMFLQIEKKLASYSNIQAALKTLNLTFLMKSVNECMFLINYIDTPIELNEIWKLQGIYSYTTSPDKNDFLYACIDFDNTIEIIFPGSSIPLGKFKAPNSDAKFCFQLDGYFFVK